MCSCMLACAHDKRERTCMCVHRYVSTYTLLEVQMIVDTYVHSDILHARAHAIARAHPICIHVFGLGGAWV